MPQSSTIWTRKRLAFAALATVVLGVCAFFGWHVYRTQTLDRVVVQGLRHADRAALLELAQVQQGQRLYGIDADIAADRMRRHPWVMEADVDRLPTGTLLVDVVERTPVALALDGGHPAYFLDRHGFRMPADSGAVYDVPLVRGLPEPYHPVQPVEDEATRALLEDLAEADDAALLLVSELEHRDGEWWALTEPAGERGTVLVRLGHDAFGERLRRLQAFWHQAVLTQPDRTFRRIDLRFDNQIVTEEE